MKTHPPFTSSPYDDNIKQSIRKLNILGNFAFIYNCSDSEKEELRQLSLQHRMDKSPHLIYSGQLLALALLEREEDTHTTKDNAPIHPEDFHPLSKTIINNRPNQTQFDVIFVQGWFAIPLDKLLFNIMLSKQNIKEHYIAGLAFGGHNTLVREMLTTSLNEANSPDDLAKLMQRANYKVLLGQALYGYARANRQTEIDCLLESEAFLLLKENRLPLEPNILSFTYPYIVEGFATAGNIELMTHYKSKADEYLNLTDKITPDDISHLNEQMIFHMTAGYLRAKNYVEVEAYLKNPMVSVVMKKNIYQRAGENLKAMQENDSALANFFKNSNDKDKLTVKQQKQEDNPDRLKQLDPNETQIEDQFINVAAIENKKELLLLLDLYLEHRTKIYTKSKEKAIQVGLNEENKDKKYEYFHWYSKFFGGKTYTAKREAIQALKLLLEGDPSHNIEAHIETLRDGKLGKVLRYFIKSKQANCLINEAGFTEVNTIREFISGLQGKLTNKMDIKP